jgi:hypothetical protein
MNNKPVAWIPKGMTLAKPKDLTDCIPLYTHPTEHDLGIAEAIGFDKGYEAATAKTLTDEEILTAIKSIAFDVGSYKEYENTYEDGWLDACNTVYDEVFAILRKAQEK